MSHQLLSKRVKIGTNLIHYVVFRITKFVTFLRMLEKHFQFGVPHLIPHFTETKSETSLKAMLRKIKMTKDGQLKAHSGLHAEGLQSDGFEITRQLV